MLGFRFRSKRSGDIVVKQWRACEGRVLAISSFTTFTITSGAVSRKMNAANTTFDCYVVEKIGAGDGVRTRDVQLGCSRGTPQMAALIAGGGNRDPTPDTVKCGESITETGSMPSTW
jgi:hypothetical protein